MKSAPSTLSPELAYHACRPAGKTAVSVTKPIRNEQELALAYSPGVAAPCQAIAANETASFWFTGRGNLVAVMTNGTAVLGLGNLGPAAAKPVMEGKAALFRQLAGIDAFDIEIDEESANGFIAVASKIAAGFGAINLEDIRAPECFEIEERLQSLLDIPVFHDDQHGTAIAIVAGLVNACAQTGRRLTDARIVINGAGAAGLATAMLLRDYGVPGEHITMLDIVGVLHEGRSEDLHPWAQPFVRQTDQRTLADAIEGADIFVGLSAKGAMKPDHVAAMAARPIVFALANPEPEIMPAEVHETRSDAIVATGRSDFPNQINNLLVFPYIFRGALDAGARRITSGMKLAALEALASLGSREPGGCLLPGPLDPGLLETLGPAVAEAALREGDCRVRAPIDAAVVQDTAGEFASPVRVPDEPDARISEPAVATRVEADFLGEIAVPADRYFGVETVRAIRNFPVTGIPISRMPELVNSLALIKKAAAITNGEAGDLADDIRDAIVAACDEILDGRHHSEFAVDVIQGGAGTSSNMNANEVIANRALELLGHARGDYARVSPKDHVNKSQSTNDVYATAIRLVVVKLNEKLVDAIGRCVSTLDAKALEFAHIDKIGRTQLQDAVPMTLGQEFAAFASALREDITRIEEMRSLFLETNLGGSAIGTGVGASVYYQDHIIGRLAQLSGLPVTPARDRIEATWDTGIFVLYSGMLKRLATKLSKISNDLRLLSSGPVGGFGEIRLPQQQPGSSIMPGKVNPVIPEMMNQVCFRIFGADTTVTFAAEAGQLQLNAMEPVIVWSIYDGGRTLIAAIDSLIDNCLQGISADADRCSTLLHSSTALVTAIMPRIGYAMSARIARHMTQNNVDLDTALSTFADEIDPESLSWIRERCMALASAPGTPSL